MVRGLITLGALASIPPQQGIGQFPVVGGVGAPACVEVDGAVVVANWTVSPFCNVSGGLSITLSCGASPAVTSTLSPKSLPSWMDLSTTLLLSPSTATCAPRLIGINAVAGMRTMFGSPGIWKSTRQ